MSPTSSPPSTSLPDRFRGVMGRFATGVTVVTAHHLSQDAGMTVNAFLSVTLEPPTVLVSLSTTADTTPLIEASGKFAISILREDQRDLSDRFASRASSTEKFEGVAVHRGRTGAPLLDGSLASIECEVVERHPYATHLLLLGKVVALEEGPEGLPLVFWRSAYAKASQGDRLIMSPPRPASPPSERPKPPRAGKRSA